MLSLSALSAAFVAVVLIWIDARGRLPGDRFFFDRAAELQAKPGVENISKLFDLVGTPAIAIVTVTMLTILAGRRGGLRAAAFVLAASAVVVLNGALKLAIGPTAAWREIALSDGDNFPSGHVAYATAVFGAIAWLASGKRHLDVRLACIAIVFAMGVTRLVIRVHLFSDVVAGYAVGLTWLIWARVLVYDTLGRRLDAGREPPSVR